MEMTRCLVCQGSGVVIGGGMITKDCEECNGSGKKIVPIINKSYSEAINKIQALDPNMSKEEAKNIFDKEMDKINKQDNIVHIKGKHKK